MHWDKPPDERPDGFECLAFHRGKWRHVKWCATHRGWSLGYCQPYITDGNRKFASLPDNHDQNEADFYGWNQ